MAPDYSKLQPVPNRDEPYHIVVTAARHDDIEFGVSCVLNAYTAASVGLR